MFEPEDQEDSTEADALLANLNAKKHESLGRDIRRYLIAQSRISLAPSLLAQLLPLLRSAGWRLRSAHIQRLVHQLSAQCVSGRVRLQPACLLSLLCLRDQRIFVQVSGLVKAQIHVCPQECGYLVPELLTVLGWYSDPVNEQILWLLATILQWAPSLPDLPARLLTKLTQLLIRAPSPNYLLAGLSLLVNLTALSQTASQQLLSQSAFNGLVFMGANSSQALFLETVVLINNMLGQTGLLKETTIQLNYQIANVFLSPKCPSQELLHFVLNLKAKPLQRPFTFNQGPDSRIEQLPCSHRTLTPPPYFPGFTTAFSENIELMSKDYNQIQDLREYALHANLRAGLGYVPTHALSHKIRKRFTFKLDKPRTEEDEQAKTKETEEKTEPQPEGKAVSKKVPKPPAVHVRRKGVRQLRVA